MDIYNVGHIINFDLPSIDHGGIHEYIHRIGRTARIGNIGIATSFYNERDEALAPSIVKLLIENEQEIPDFLDGFKPEEGAPLNFDEEDEAIDVTADADGGDAWGAADRNGNGDAWGATKGTGNGDAWGSAGNGKGETSASAGDTWGGANGATNDAW